MRLSNGDLQWTVERERAPLRVDHYLKLRLPRYSRAQLQDYVRRGDVLKQSHDGQLVPLKPSARVAGGDIILLRRTTPPSSHIRELPREPLQVLYEDDALMVVSKPAGMLVHPTTHCMDGTVLGELKQRYGNGLLDLAHRLDRETSGVLVLTRRLDATRRVKSAFKNRRVRKVYLAVVKGVPDWEERLVDLPMGPGSSSIRLRQVVRPDGYPARTRFRRLRILSPGYCLLEAGLETGRLHQIRVHLEALGLALVGEKIYGGDGAAFMTFVEQGLTPALLAQVGHWRQALHAYELELEHPLTGERKVFRAPLPADLVELMARLEASDETDPEDTWTGRAGEEGPLSPA